MDSEQPGAVFEGFDLAPESDCSLDNLIERRDDAEVDLAELPDFDPEDSAFINGVYSPPRNHIAETPTDFLSPELTPNNQLPSTSRSGDAGAALGGLAICAAAAGLLWLIFGRK